MSTEVLKRRIKQVKKGSTAGHCVLYVMSRDQRIRDNHALLAAQKHAMAKKLPLAIVFCLIEKTGYRSREHYEFMLEGLREVERDAQKLHIPFMMIIGSPYDRLGAVLHHTKPDAVYFDFSPLRGPRRLIQRLSEHDHGAALYVVDTHNTIPAWLVSDKKEVAAYTLRPKIHKNIEQFLIEPELLQKHPHPWPGTVQSLTTLAVNIQAVLDNLTASGNNIQIKSGERAAADQLEKFIESGIDLYAKSRNDPVYDSQSNLSPYLHFGQLSSLRITLAMREKLVSLNNDLHIIESQKMPSASNQPTWMDGANAFLEELLVRKELSDNYCFYEPHYDSLAGAAEWAQQTLNQHKSDVREFCYSYKQLAAAKTHDPAWNAAQNQMLKSGKMHGYMRMYWAKKVLEWTESPAQAIEFLIRLNDSFSIDGGDPNGYVGIMWSVAGVHDRPWVERPVFGKIRYMNYGGLKRKFDIAQYEHTWN